MNYSNRFRFIASVLILVIFINFLPVYGSDVWGSGQEILQGKKTYYIYSCDNKLIAEYDREGHCLREYIYAGGLLVAEYRPQTNKYLYFTNDQINSTRVVTDDSGNVVSSTTYSPFGKKIQSAQIIEEAPKPQFSGKEREQITSTDYFGARYYDHSTYRFNSTDPVISKKEALVDPQRWNLYAYCRNNPITYLDPDGKRETPHARFLSGMFLRDLEEMDGKAGGAFYSFMYKSGWSAFGAAVGGAIVGSCLALGFAAAYAGEATVTLTTTATSGAATLANNPGFNWNRWKHVFREAPGHIRRVWPLIQKIFIKISSKVASNPKNFDVLSKTLDERQIRAGVQAYYYMATKWHQIWVYVLNNKIVNAGINKGERIKIF